MPEFSSKKFAIRFERSGVTYYSYGGPWYRLGWVILMKATAYFEQKLLERPEIKREWCQHVIQYPLNFFHNELSGKEAPWYVFQ